VSGRGFISAEKARTCELCGRHAETRPYGPGGKEICADCGLLDIEETEKRMRHALGDGYVLYVFDEKRPWKHKPRQPQAEPKTKKQPKR